MIRITSVIAASLLATSAFAADKADTGPAKAEVQSSAVLSSQEGTVLVNQGEEFITATDAQVLNFGDRVLVMEGSSAEIVFNDGCVLPLESGSLLAVPAISTCASGSVASVETIGPTYAQAVGATNDDDDPSTARVTFWVGAALIAIVATAGGDSDPLPPVPVSP